LINDLLRDRYLLPHEEDWIDLCNRVAMYLFPDDEKKYNQLYTLMSDKKFIPSTPTLMNAGTDFPMLSSCFALGMEDNMDSITDVVAKRAAKVFKMGGGVGIDFSVLRPKGSKIGSTGGTSDGIIPFMKLFDQVADTVKQGAKRRGAAISTLDVSHPDIVDFIKCKTEEGKLSNMNISVRITDEFMDCVKNDGVWVMEFGDIRKKMRARELWDLICESAWKYGEPGVIFIDTIKRLDNKHVEIDKYRYGQNPSLLPTTKVLTENGIFEVKDLCDKEFYVPSNSGFSKARCILSGKDKQIMEVKLNGNITYYATPEHYWVTTEYGKLTTSELKPGMYLPTKKWNYSFGNIGTYDEGFLIGWNYGDGSITQRADNGKHQYGFVFGESDIKNGIYDKIRDTLTSITGEKYNPTARNRGKQNWIEISVINHKLDNLFKKYGFSGKQHGLPNSMFTDMSDSFNRGFIDGLFSADASINNSNKYKSGEKFIFASSRKKLAYDVNELLGFYGIQTSINKEVATDVSFPNGKDYEREYTIYKVNIKDIYRFRNIFTLTHTNKNNSINSMIKKRVYDKIKIESIRNTDIISDVYDLQVYDGDHEFTLSHCQTHNCSEAILLTTPGGGESCNLGSINVSLYENTADLGQDIMIAVDTLNSVIDRNLYPNEEIEMMTKKFRRIGLGVMGVHDYLIKRGIRYGTPQSYVIIRELCKFLTNTARKYSDKMGYNNLSVTCVAPTGSISIIADCSSGIEPNTSYVYDRIIWRKGEPVKYKVVHPLFKQHLEDNYDDIRRNVIMEHMYRHGTIKDCLDCNPETRELFVTAIDLTPEQHVMALAAAQEGIEMSVSKTVNLPFEATVKDVSDIYEMCYANNIKGVTIYRAGSRDLEVISTSKEKSTEGIIPKSHPDVMYSITVRRKTGCGTLWLTITLDEKGLPFAIFIKNSEGGCTANINAIARMTSANIRAGIDLNYIIDQLKTEKCTVAKNNPNAQGLSCSHIIGSCLEQCANGTLKPEYIIPTLIIPNDTPKCPKCNEPLAFTEGCITCKACGYSRCG
jgi:ribonucleoside-diphosphate reductase alpha chain